MIRSAITVSLVPEARGGPFVFWDDLPAACQAAAEFEFDAIEIFPPAADAIPPATLWKLLNEHGLKLAAVGTGAGWVKHKLTLTSADAAIRQQAREFVRSIIDFAGPFGAPAIIGSMQGRFGDGTDRETALGYLADGLEELAEHARTYRVPLLYEPLNRNETNLINTVDDAVAYCEKLASNNVRLLCDLYHMSIEEVDIPAALHRAGRHLGHLHFVDSNRRPAGCGSIDYRPIVAALEQIGYGGYASAEAVPWPDSLSAARQTITMYKQLFFKSH
jgi:sugar phosphate isomerase/epimerase